ncbi:hypothetical protein, partial [Pseudonocardia pini]|uniref:hypothetical protein n=1 Tax=Pseudonocardia pini TaxID=2758030 RepID=UPI0015F0118F
VLWQPGGIGMLARIRPGLVWELLAAGDRVTGAECARLGIGEATDGPALDAALDRAATFGAIERDVLGHYVGLERAANWPSPEHFADAAEIQSGLIASERFRAFADRVLGRS